MNRTKLYVVTTLFTILFFALGIRAAVAQEILLDQMVEAGGLKLFPAYGKPKVFYYLPDKVRIPDGQDGKPQFSFLNFVRNVDGSGEGGVQEGEGGGLVHFLVAFDIDERTKQKAEQELRQKVGGARIAGPVTYKSGTFALISSFQQEDGDWTTRVVGFGKAPVMEGHKAAVSLRLKAEGATILWESFKQAASDISLSFEMVISGYRNSYEATLEADWSKIAKNKALAVGGKSTWMGFDIQKTMKELKEEGAITFVVKGESEKMGRLWEMAYGKIAEQIFDPESDPTTLATLQDDKNLYSNFEKAVKFNRGERTRVRKDNREEREREERELSREENRKGREREARELSREDARALARAKYLPILDLLSLGDSGAGSASGGEDGSSGGGASSGGGGQAPDSQARQGGPPTASRRVTPANIQNPPSFALLAAYRQKRFKKTGKYRLSFIEHQADTQAMRFDENIGGFSRRMFNDPQHFRIINLDNPAYKQREVLASLDGQDSADFGKFVNFVIVSMRKRHQDGSVTNKELKIDKANFNKSNNSFRMVYGYKGDKNRDKWLEFDYKTVWSLYGGATWDSGWQKTREYVLPVTPPHRYREITIEADPDILYDARVRLVTVTFYYELFGKGHSELVELKPTREGLQSKTVRYAHEPGNHGYEYEVAWRLRGGKVIKSGRIKGNEATIFADELP